MVGFLWLKSHKKFPFIVTCLLLLPVGFMMMPDEWTQRITGIGNYESDGSSMGRIYAWTLATKIALNSPIVGEGFGTFGTRELHDLYAESITGVADSSEQGIYIATDPHSIFFLVLGEHGFVGLTIFLFLLYASFRMAGRIKKLTQDRADLDWARLLGPALQASIVGYAVGGAFLGQSYFDFYYHLIALTVVTRQYVVDTVNTEENEAEAVVQPIAPAPS